MTLQQIARAHHRLRLGIPNVGLWVPNSVGGAAAAPARETTPRFVPVNLARSNLRYSWATLMLLGRAVHCNLGRPPLCVFSPSA